MRKGHKKKKQPQARFELATFRLLSECSTPKLLWRVTTLWKQVVRMAQWIRRLPTEQEILGSSPSTDCLFFFLVAVHSSRARCKKQQQKGGDARIELATSCTRSRNHTTRPITLLRNSGIPHPSPSKNVEQKVMRDVLELNQRPIGLQPIALPLS